jgi:hypothetical protein
VRARVEFLIAVIKRGFGFVKVRYRGLAFCSLLGGNGNDVLG